MNFNLLNSIILAGVLQGFLFGVIYLVSKKYRNTNFRYLALLIITFSYNNLQFYLSDVGLISGDTMYKTIYLPMGPLIPVFIYLYVLEFTKSPKRLFPKKVLYFLPFLVFTCNILIYKIWSLFAPMADNLYKKFKFINDIQSIFSALYTIILIALSFHIVRRHDKNQYKNHTTINKSLAWLKKTLIILFTLTLLWTYALTKYLTDASYRIYFQFLWLGLSFTIYWLGHLGIYRYGILEERKKIRKLISKTNQYFTSDFNPNEHISTFEQLLKGEKYFLRHGLTLDEMAQELGISKGHLSRIINSELQTNFSEYVNTLRVEESKKLLIDPEFSKYTLVAIGLEAGFSSKSTFNSTFKKVTGYTPSQFKKQKEN